MLIHQNRIAIRIDNNETGRAGRIFVCFRLYSDPFVFELPLEVPDIGKRIQFIGILIPSRIEGQNVFIKHALK